MKKRRYGLDYSEEATLKDGSPVIFRLVRPEDKALIVEGLARMSPETRFRRFFSHRDRLSPSELAYLTEIDHERHFALAAGRPGGDGADEIGLGVARFVVLDGGAAGAADPADPPPPRAAEAAIAVVDEAQGKGLGRMLFERLVAAAAEREIAVFRFDVLAENDTMLGLVKSLFPDATGRVEDGIMTIDCPIPDLSGQEPGARPEGALYHILKLAAEGAIRIFRGARESDSPSFVLKSGNGRRAPDAPETEHDLAALIGLTDEDGPGPANNR